jgi:hypothetical protein
VEYHVDARVMTMIVDSLVEELELLDSYTLVILNPRKNLLGGRYGYRQGFSAEEMAELRRGCTSCNAVNPQLERRLVSTLVLL